MPQSTTQQQVGSSPADLGPVPDSSLTSLSNSAIAQPEPSAIPDFAKALMREQQSSASTTDTASPTTTHASTQPPPAWKQQLPIASLAIALGIALVAWSLWQRSRLSRRAAARIVAPQPASAVALADDAKLRREMAELTQHMAQQLDSRAQRLEKLLDQANQRVATLESLLAQSPRATTIIEPKPPAATSLHAAPSAHRDVYTLADEGLSPVEIAQRLGKPTGQVELILNLRKVSLV
jgi:hypothetical protein